MPRKLGAANPATAAAEEIDRDERVPMETIKKAAKLGLMGVPFPQKYGGVGAGETGYCILMEELNKICGSTATVVGAHTGIGAMAIYLDGTEEQKQKRQSDEHGLRSESSGEAAQH
jgi:alkylation response protein AidB-like acyl-CoA dehydrogenase